MGKLDNKVAVITGAASGMGKATARRAVEYGAKVNLLDFSPKVMDYAEELKAQGYEATGYQLDVGNKESVKQVIDSVVNNYGKIDILVNAAGICRPDVFTEDDADTVRDQQFHVNFYGVWNTCQAVLSHMLLAKYGKIVNFSSVTGPMVANNNMAGYAATKAAVMGLTKELALETAPFNITVNAIMPGMIDTPMVAEGARALYPENPQDYYDLELKPGIPMKRLGRPEEVAEVVCFLVSDESSYVTGVSIPIDGGSLLPEVNQSPTSCFME